MKQYGYIHHHVNALNKNLKHEGLDITRSLNSRSKTQMQLELNDFDLLNGTFVMTHSSFDKNTIAKLFDSVITKYFESPEKAGEVNKAIDNDELPVTQTVNGKVIKSITKKDGEYFVNVSDSNPSAELSKMVNDIINVNSAAHLQLQERILKCANALRVGTLDIVKGTKDIVIHTTEGVKPLEGNVTRQQMIATLWFVTKSYMYAPSFRKFLTVSVTEGKYTAGYDKGIPFFKAEGLTQVEQDIINDLKLIG